MEQSLQRQPTTKTVVVIKPLFETHLGLALVGDVAAAVSASAFVAPFVCIIDKAIIQNAAGAASLEISIVNSFLDAVKRPITFLRRPEVLMVWGVYSFTYVAANIITTTCEVTKKSADMPRLFGTTGANMLAGIAKDRAFARMFGTTTPHAMPMASYMAFLSRDLATVGASFNWPSPTAKLLHRHLGMDRQQAEKTAQVLCPVLIQTFTTPMHLLGLDFYNRPKASMAERVGEVMKHYNKSVAARMARIAPAFGFGGLGNTYFRNSYRNTLSAFAHTSVRLPHTA